jgi:ABC-type sugar transport system substrate-binding protein
MRKRIVAIVLAAVLVAGGLGSFAHAQEPVNSVHAHFDTHWVYDSPGDEFTGGDDEVTGRKEWHADLWNEPDDTVAPVTAAELTLDSELEIDWVEEENLTTMGPPTYEWSFGDVPEESDAHAGVAFGSPDPSPVIFTPGFDASRSADITEFTEPDTQTLTITLTPRATIEGFHIHVDAWEDDLGNPVITSPVSGDGINLDPDGHWLDIDPRGLVVDDEWTTTVTIDVTPKVPELNFMPDVQVMRGEEVDSGTITGSSVSRPAGDPVGTWTWSADGSYEWHWWDSVARRVTFPDYRYEPGNKVHTDFSNDWVYDVPGDSFTNDEVTGRKEWNADIWNEADETEAVVSSAELSLDSELEFDWVDEENLTTMGPPTYEWSFGDVPEESNAHGHAGFGTPAPSPVIFTPGFDASRSADITEFTEPDTQTLTITLTPQEATEWFHIYVGAWEDDLVNPVITSPVSGYRINFDPDGHRLDMDVWAPEIGTTYTYYVTIDVTPKIPVESAPLNFMPEVHVMRGEELDSGTERGSSVSRPAGDPIGTWTWSADGDYIWYWWDGVTRKVMFPNYRYQDIVQARFLSVPRYDVPGEEFTNHEVIGRKLWAALISNQSLELVNDLTVSLDSELEFDRVTMENRTQIGPPTYEWFCGDAYQWFFTAKVVGFATPDPSPVTFTPGFDASVSADKTEFSGPDTQTLTITVTPREEQVATGLELMGIFVMSDEQELDGALLDPDDLVDAVITSPSCDGRLLNIRPTGLELDTTYTYYVTIEVTPKVPGVVEYMPEVHIDCVKVLDSGTTEGSSVSCPARDPADPLNPAVEVGTWTVSADGSYNWYSEDCVDVSLTWGSYSREVQDWSVPLAVTSTIGSADVSFGANSDATDGFDGYDVPAPPPPMEGVEAYFNYPDNPENKKKLATSIVAPADTIIWPLKVRYITEGGAGEVTISWDSTDIDNVPGKYITLELEDAGGSELADMRSETEYTFTADPYVIYSFQIKAAANTPPVVANITAIQRTDGSGIVDITYDVTDVEQGMMHISLEYWEGSYWGFCDNTAGDVGGGVATGTGKAATWDAKTQFAHLLKFIGDCRIRVTADDGAGGSTSLISGPFTIDTAPPTGYGCGTPSNAATGVSVDPTLTCLTASDDSPPIYYKFLLDDNSSFDNSSGQQQESGWQEATEWSPATLTAGTVYWWKVKAKDSYGNERQYSVAYNFTTELSFDIPLKAGWNMFGLPVDPGITNPGDIFSSVSSYYLYTWDAVDKKYVIPTELTPCKGYWILVFDDVTQTVHGTPIHECSLSGGAGWHMIGSLSVEAQVDVISGDVYPQFYTWDAVDKKYVLSTSLEPGGGYWLLAFTSFSATVLPEVPPPPPLPEKITAADIPELDDLVARGQVQGDLLWNPFKDLLVKPDGTPYKVACTVSTQDVECVAQAVCMLEDWFSRMGLGPKGGNWTTFGAHFDLNAQVAWFEDMAATMEPDWFMCHSVDADLEVPVVESMVYEEGIPVFTMDCGVNTSAVTSFIAHKFEGPGGTDVLAEWLVDALQAKGYGPENPVTVLEEWGMREMYTAQMRHQGFHSVVDSYPWITVIESPDTNWAPQQTATITADMMQDHPEIKAIWHHGCGGAGIVPGLDSIGRLYPIEHPDHIIVASNDSDIATWDQIIDGSADACSTHAMAEPTDIGLQVATTNVVLGQPVDSFYQCPYIMVTRDNIDTVQIGGVPPYPAWPRDRWELWLPADPEPDYGFPQPSLELRMLYMGY